MAKLKRLLDIYRFPGFVPRPKVHGLFGDPLAVVISLRRRRKKRAAVSAVRLATRITTSGHAASETCPVATSASTWTSPSGASLAPGVAA